jgi:hypothetical protein
VFIIRVLAAAILFLGPARAWADEAEDAFNSLYGNDYKRVLASRDTADDVVLAAQLLQAAKAKETQPALAGILCEKARELGSRAPAGYETAADAMEFLAGKFPDRKAPCLEKVVEIRQKQYDAARGLDKANAGEIFIEAVIAAADANGEAGAAAEGSALLKRAMTMATALKSDRKGEIQARLDRLAWRIRAEKQVANLKAKLAANPQDAATRKELIRLCLIDMDDPASAATFLDESCDESMRKYVPAVSRGVDAAPEIACMELGEWYRGLAEASNALGKESLMKRARAYYERFMKLHTAEDLLRNQAGLALKKADEALVKLAPRGSGIIGPGRWVDLARLVDLQKDVVQGKGDDGRDTWKIRDGNLVTTGGSNSRVSLPVAPAGSYEMEIDFERTRGEHGVFFVLPVGASGVGCLLSHATDGLRLENTRPAAPKFALPKLINGQTYTIHFRVLVAGDQADVSVELNGKPCANWSGPQSALSVPDWCRPKDPRCPGLGGTYIEVVFKSIRLRMLTGTVKMLR